MRHFVLGAAVFAAVLVAADAAQAPGSPAASAPAGEIAFVSDRATANPGEIFALAPGTAPRDLSRSPYADVGLATSPVGRAYAFWSNRTGPWRLLVAPGGGALRTVVVGGASGPGVQFPSVAPLFSPDGTRLLVPYVPAHAPGYALTFALADVRAGPARAIRLPCGQPPVWSPDGLRVACFDTGGRRVAVADLTGHVQFALPGTALAWSRDGRLAVAGTKTTRVVSAAGVPLARLDGALSGWSRDGRLLALTPRGKLVVASPGASRSRVVARIGNRTFAWVAFTPDGRDVAYEVNGDPRTRMVAVAGGPARPFPGAAAAGAWSPDGRHYAFALYQRTTVVIMVGDRLGAHARAAGRLAYNDHELSGYSWLGDSSRLLYDGSVHDHADLWSMRADGSGQHRLTRTGQLISQPAWSADGTLLAYGSSGFKGGNCGYCGGSIAIADSRGRKQSLVPGSEAHGESSEGSASWAPGGTQLAVTDLYSGGVYVTGLTAGDRVQIAPEGSASPAWSPDGTTVAYVSSFGGGAVMGVDPAGAGRRRLLPGSGLKATSVAWSPDGRRLAFSTRSGVYVAAADGSGAARRVAAEQSPGRPTFSPDGRLLAFAAQAGALHPYSAVYEVGVGGGGLRQLTTGPFDSADPAWRPG